MKTYIYTHTLYTCVYIHIYTHTYVYNVCGYWDFSGGSVVKESACSAGATEDEGLIPGLGRSPGEGMATHSSVLACRIPWTEELGRLRAIGSQRVGHD